MSVVHSDGAARSAGMCTGMLPRECVSASRSAYEPGITAPCSSTQVMPDRLTLSLKAEGGNYTLGHVLQVGAVHIWYGLK